MVVASLAPTTALASEAALTVAGWPPSLLHPKPPIPPTPLKNSFYSMSQAATSTVHIDDQREEAIKNDSSMKSIVDGNGLSDSLSRKRHRRRPSLFDLRRRRQRTEKNDNLRPRRIISVSEAIRRMKQVRVPPKCIFFVFFAVENVSLSIV